MEELIGNVGVDISLSDSTPKGLFKFVKATFAEQEKVILHVEYSSKYIASLEEDSSIFFG